MRILLVSTPRSGNMWARRLLRALFALEERSAHRPGDIDWATLPERVIVQLHTQRTAEMQRIVAEHGLRVVVLARHPLDVLVSILHFARHEPQTAEWLGGQGGDERRILDADPTSRAFVRYATSRRAKALLEVTPAWWEQADARLRYEDLVSDPRAELQRVTEALGEQPAKTVDDVLEEVTFTTLQREADNVHFWRGQPGTWQQLMPMRVARRLIDAHYDVVEKLGYAPLPDEDTARRRWREYLVQ